MGLIDFVERETGSGFKITNPNEPVRVRPLSAEELRAMHDSGQALELFDVRPDVERNKAKIDWAKKLDREGQDYLFSLPRETPIAFYCHHGLRSRSAAEHFLAEGFREVYNLEGGIDAWSRVADPGVPRY